MSVSAPVPHHDLTGPPDAPLLVLGPSLGTSTTVWEPLLPALARTFRVARFDLPGHGGSPAAPGAVSVADLAALVLALVDRLGHRRFHYAGISLGGAVGTRLAARHPHRVDSLALVCTSAWFGPAGPWRERAALVREQGTRPLLATGPGRWFADPAIASTAYGRALLRDLATADPSSYAACCDALADCDLRRDLARITAPTLVVGGTLDIATPLPHARELAAGIAGATLATIPTGHLGAEDHPALEALLSAHLGRNRHPAFRSVPGC
ncbi:hypothetical protein GCM10010387_51390 [Streptomyces inusitatus]|uniref:AB hydrolase-1 domain-containing protein n=1 Tax=Streptomyces inusitatus TaxID=68221 RepID=A0A918QKI3_9ACTN|nr:alpha/beta fold hydrolase [Streptomyces inusitatus]GGZ50793.1 hypothetical protein GCM10010387_51390 [Streptomyces inusitatus]